MDDKNLPNFMRPKKLQECKDREMWSKQFRAAFYIFWATAIIGGIATKSFLFGFSFLGLAFFTLVTDAILDTRHVMWHIKNNEKGEKHE